MSNPWTKKNPLMSMWLSSANAMLGSTRAQASAQVKRQASQSMSAATRQFLDFWTGAVAAAPPARKKRKRAR